MTKKLCLLIFGLMIIGTNRSQSPHQLSFQSVVRDNNNQLISNRTIGMRLSILRDSTNGQAVYAEIHSPKTTQQGTIQLNIGAGTLVSGSFASIPWSTGKLFVKTEIDLQGGSNYTMSNVTQLLSVPYTMYASDIPVSKSGDTVTIGKSRLVIPGSQLVGSAVTANLNNGLVGYWPFNGNANDESGNGKHLIVHGNTALTTDIFNGTNKAYLLDGNGDYFSVQSIFSSGLDHSISMWFQLTDSTWTDNTFYNTYPHPIEAVNYNGTAPLRANGFGYCVGDSADWDKCDETAVFRPTFPKKNWNNIIIVKGEKTWKFYLNGVLAHTFESRINTPTRPVALYIGAISSWFSDVAAQFLKGKLDDIRLYNRVLNSEEISYLANN